MRHLRIYKAIDTVARHRSIRSAAHILAISPSALNRQIQGLEAELGVELFERLARGVRLSTAGEIYLRAFRSHLAELDRAAAQIGDLSGLRSGHVRLGVGPELSWGAIPKVVASYRSDFPHLSIEVTVIACDRVSEALQDFEIDLHIGANPVFDEAVEIVHSQQAHVACIGAGGDGVMRLSELADAPQIVNTAASGLRRMIDASFAARSIPLRYALITDQLSPDIASQHSDASIITIDTDRLDPAQAAPGRRLDPRDLGALYIKITRLKSRALPIGASRLAERLVALLEKLSD